MKPVPPPEPYHQQFEQLFLEHFPGLYAYGVRLTADRELTRETIQVLFANLWEKQPPLSSVQNWNAYLRRALHHELVRELTKRNQQRGLDTAEPLAVATYEDAWIRSEEETEQQRRLRTAIEALPAGERKMVEAKFLQERSYDEIAEQTGKSKRTVYNQVHGAIRKLRAALTKLPMF